MRFIERDLEKKNSHWIKEFIFLVSFLVLVNGSPSVFFFFKGNPSGLFNEELREGDPLT